MSTGSVADCVSHSQCSTGLKACHTATKLQVCGGGVGLGCWIGPMGSPWHCSLDCSKPAAQTSRMTACRSCLQIKLRQQYMDQAANMERMQQQTLQAVR